MRSSEGLFDRAMDTFCRMRFCVQAIPAHFSRAEAGQTVVEYGIILAVIALVAVVAMRVLGVDLSNTITTMSCWLRPNAAGCQGY